MMKMTFLEACETIIEQSGDPPTKVFQRPLQQQHVNLFNKPKSKDWSSSHVFSNNPRTPEEMQADFDNEEDYSKTSKSPRDRFGDPFDVLSNKPSPSQSAIKREIGDGPNFGDTDIHQEGPIGPNEFRDFVASFGQFQSKLDGRLDDIENRLQAANL